VWSLGIVLYRMMFGSYPFMRNSLTGYVRSLSEADIECPAEVPVCPTLLVLLRRMLQKKPEDRISWQDIFEYTISEDGRICAPGEGSKQPEEVFV
jgi:serine/threonine protein kinase